MIKNLAFRFVESIFEEIKYFKIIVRLFIFFFTFLIFLFFENIFEEKFTFCCFSFFTTVSICSFFFMREEKKLLHRFNHFFYFSYLTKKKEKDIREFRKKLYFQNIKRAIKKLFTELKIKNGCFGLIYRSNEIQIFYYDDEKVQVLLKKGDLTNKKLLQFLQTSKDCFHNFQESDNRFKTTLESLKSNCIISLKFKDQLIGFLTFNQIQKNFFQNIESVVIQESSILLYNLVGNEMNYKDDKLKDELKKANISSQFLKKIHIPSISNIKIELSELTDQFLESCQNVKGNVYLILTSFENFNQQQIRLIMSYITGLFFSLQSQVNIEISIIQKLIQKKFRDIEWKTKENMLLIEIQPELKSFKFSILGEKIKFFNNTSFSKSNQNEKWIFYHDCKELLSLSQI